VGFCVDLSSAESNSEGRTAYFLDDTGARVGTVLRGVGSLLEDLLDHSLSSAYFPRYHGDMKGIRGHTAESVKV
jgi:hypothetical protein